MADPVVEGFGRLPTAVVADIFRLIGYPQQVVDPAILPLTDGWSLCGRAFTLANLPARPGERNRFNAAEKEYAPGEVVVHSYWGSSGVNTVLKAVEKGCVGVVIDGPYRDIPEHRKLLPHFPVFCRRGLSERSSNPGSSHRGFQTRWMYAHNVPINCGGVRVEPGDIVLGDEDGLVVVPKDVEEITLGFALSFEQVDTLAGQLMKEGKSREEAYAAKRAWPRTSGLLDWLAKNGYRSIMGGEYDI